MGTVIVYFTSSSPLDPRKHLKRGEYYCRSVYDPALMRVYTMKDPGIVKHLKEEIEEELINSPYPHALVPGGPDVKKPQVDDPVKRQESAGGGALGGGGEVILCKLEGEGGRASNCDCTKCLTLLWNARTASKKNLDKEEEEVYEPPPFQQFDAPLFHHPCLAGEPHASRTDITKGPLPKEDLRRMFPRNAEPRTIVGALAGTMQPRI
jgi:hypothetical protein